MSTPLSISTSCVRWEEKWKQWEFVTHLGKHMQLVKRCRWRVAAKVPWHSPEFGTKEQPHMPPANAGGTEGHSHAILSEQAKDHFKIKLDPSVIFCSQRFSKLLAINHCFPPSPSPNTEGQQQKSCFVLVQLFFPTVRFLH